MLRNDRLAKRVSHLAQGGIYGEGYGANGAKSCETVGTVSKSNRKIVEAETGSIRAYIHHFTVLAHRQSCMGPNLPLSLRFKDRVTINLLHVLIQDWEKNI
jgi:hypothetical protein